jgi:hypothetical protein
MIDLPCLIVVDRCFNLGPVRSRFGKIKEARGWRARLVSRCVIYTGTSSFPEPSLPGNISFRKGLASNSPVQYEFINRYR